MNREICPAELHLGAEVFRCELRTPHSGTHRVMGKVLDDDLIDYILYWSTPKHEESPQSARSPQTA